MRNWKNGIFNLIGLFFIIFFSMDIFYLILQKKKIQLPLTTKKIESFSLTYKERKRPSFNEYKSIIDKNIFGIKNQSLSSKEAIAKEVIKPTKLKLLLIGTAVAGPENSVAIIRDLVKRQEKCYRIGDIVQGAVIKEIYRGKVILSVNGKVEVLFMKKERQHEENSTVISSNNEYNPTYPLGNEKVVLRSKIKNSFRNLQKLMSGARIIPYFKGKKPYGMMILNIKQGSIFEELGLKNGDIIQNINGRPLKGVDDFMILYKDINSNYKISLGIERQGKKQIIELLIK